MNPTNNRIPGLVSPVKNETASYDLSKLARLFTCPLCHGYLVDAVAINECHHRFCKSCIYSYFFKDVFNRRKEQAEQHHLKHPPNSSNPPNNKNIIKTTLQHRLERANSSSSLNSTTSTVKSSVSTFSPPPSFASSTTSSINQQVSSKLADDRLNNAINGLSNFPAPTSELETEPNVFSHITSENSIPSSTQNSTIFHNNNIPNSTITQTSTSSKLTSHQPQKSDIPQSVPKSDLPPFSPSYQPPSNASSTNPPSNHTSQQVTTCPICPEGSPELPKPWISLIPDQRWQNLVYVFFPEAFKQEQENRMKFWKSRGFNYQQKSQLNLSASLSETKDKLKKSLSLDKNELNFEFIRHEEILKQFPPVPIVKEITIERDSKIKKNEGKSENKTEISELIRKMSSDSSSTDDCLVFYNYSSKKSAVKKEISMITTQDLVEWTWIQCENVSCLKWRRVPPDSFDEKKPWYCRMNVVEEFSTCLAVEEDYRLYNRAIEKNEDQIGYIYSELPEGSVVWAKVGLAAPKWPGVICRHPVDQNFIEYDDDGDIFAYHIEFLGKPHTTGFSLAQDTEIYSRQSGDKARKQKQSKKSRMKNMLIALDEADAFIRIKNCGRILEQCLFFTNPEGRDGRRNINEAEQNAMEEKEKKRETKIELKDEKMVKRDKTSKKVSGGKGADKFKYLSKKLIVKKESKKEAEQVETKVVSKVMSKNMTKTPSIKQIITSKKTPKTTPKTTPKPTPKTTPKTTPKPTPKSSRSPSPKSSRSPSPKPSHPNSPKLAKKTRKLIKTSNFTSESTNSNTSSEETMIPKIFSMKTKKDKSIRNKSVNNEQTKQSNKPPPNINFMPAPPPVFRKKKPNPANKKKKKDKVIENQKSWSSGSTGSNSQPSTPVYDFDLPVGAVIEEVVDDTYANFAVDEWGFPINTGGEDGKTSQNSRKRKLIQSPLTFANYKK